MFKFLEAKAKSICRSVGYLLPSLMIATSFLLANSDAHFLNGTHLQPLNLYTLSVGHPGTRKLPAIETVLASLREVDTITKETLVSAATSSGLVKTTQGKALVASPELFDILNKLFKNNEDNATGDIQLLCKLWSGESASYHFATEATQKVESNTAFSFLGSTQIQNAALLSFRMDKGNGILDHFLISGPNAHKKKKPQNTSKRLQLKDFQPVFAPVHAAHQEMTRSYRLNGTDAELYKRLKIDDVNAVKAAIENREVPPKSGDESGCGIQCHRLLHCFVVE